MIRLNISVWYVIRRGLKLAFFPLGQLPSIYILLIYNTHQYYQIASIGVSEYFSQSWYSTRGLRGLSDRGFRSLKPPPLRASLSLSEAYITTILPLRLLVPK